MRLDTIIIGDMNMDVLGNCCNGHILTDFCSTFNLTQLGKEPTRTTGASETLIDIALLLFSSLLLLLYSSKRTTKALFPKCGQHKVQGLQFMMFKVVFKILLRLQSFERSNLGLGLDPPSLLTLQTV